MDLIARESIFYQRDGQSGELRESSDGEYMISLPSDAAGWYSFTLVRKSEDREQIDREVDDNYVYLPNAFQSVQAQPQQSGSVININWAIDDTTAQSINSFTIDGSEDTFNAIATCQAESGAFDIAITEGELVQQNGLWLLEIPVTQTLAQVTTLTAEAIASASCDFDVQLVRTTIGITDISLNRKSSASGQVLENVSIQWMAQ